MNYLCHFFIDVNPKEGPEFHAGLIMPDLARGILSGLGKANFQESNLLKGCQKHFQADKKFHQSAFFEFGSNQCIALMKRLAFNNTIERKWFIGHVLFEMLLDRLLVQHFPEVAPAFYKYLREVNEAELFSFLTQFKCKEPDKFLKSFEHFRKTAYIANYPDNNLFAYSLSRVLKRVGIAELSFSDKVILMEGITEIENTMFANRQSLFLELKNTFE